MSIASLGLHYRQPAQANWEAGGFECPALGHHFEPRFHSAAGAGDKAAADEAAADEAAVRMRGMFPVLDC